MNTLMHIFAFIGGISLLLICIACFLYIRAKQSGEWDSEHEFVHVPVFIEAIEKAKQVTDTVKRAVIGEKLGVAIVTQDDDAIKKMIVRLNEILNQQKEKTV